MTATTYESLKDNFRKVTKPCEICGSTRFASFQRHGRIAGPGVYGEVPIAVCLRCGFKMQSPRYEDDFYIKYYEAMYREVAFGSLAPSDTYVTQQRARGAGVLLYAQEHGIPPGKMLDHGCASGSTMLAWRDAGWDVSGIDPHGPSVEMGRANGFEIALGVGEALPFGDCAFDLILSLGSTEHAYDLAKTMQEAWRVLKPGGHLLIRWRSNQIFGSPLEYYNHNHYRFFTPNTWKLCLSRYGFRILSTTDRKLEGWDSYSYILARRDERLDEDAVKSHLEAGVRDDAEAELTNIAQLRRAYYNRCQAFLVFARDHADEPPATLLDKLRKGEAGFHMGFIGGDPGEVLERSRMEAVRYAVEFDAGRVV